MSDSNPNVAVLLELKSAVLNIDWEISDETLTELAGEVSKLQVKWAGKKVLLVYLQIIGALCQYIGVSREKSHPGTFLLLKEAFDGLEVIVENPAMAQAEQNRDVMAYAERYNQLKKEIAAGDFIPGPPQEEDDEKSTMDRLMDDADDHATDTVFDSMLNAMVQSPEDEESEADSSGAEPEVVVPTPPPARPPVQAAFNKADGTEVEPDRNEDDEFVEADELLDEFFDDDDDIPAPEEGQVSDSKAEEEGGVFDLDDLQDESEEEILDLATQGDEALADEGYVERDLTGSSDEQGDDSADLVHDDGELVIDIDAKSDKGDEPEESFQEMEEALDDFFGDEDEDDLLEPVNEEAEDGLVIDEALDDFFDEDEDESVVHATKGGAAEEPEDVSSDADEYQQNLGEEDESEGIRIESEDEADLIVDSGRQACPEEDTADEFVVEEDELDRGETSEDAKYDEIERHAEEAEPIPVTGSVAACVEDLKMLLLSVEGEVDDQLLHRLEEEIESLSEVVQDNAHARIHLSLLGTVIRYIGREQADVISDSMTCLKLLADSLENLLQDKTGDTARYSDIAVQSFVDWHELVVLDFENRLARGVKNTEVVSDPAVIAVEESAEDLDADEPAIPLDIQGFREDILKEVRELVVREIAGLKS
ncbi:MAG: hypothetical protein PF495_14145 [Spirochaetales bacterium]|jgi:hypothetical protein|nr:hypothetical protein [Spirochaetales bacterium]